MDHARRVYNGDAELALLTELRNRKSLPLTSSPSQLISILILIRLEPVRMRIPGMRKVHPNVVVNSTKTDHDQEERPRPPVGAEEEAVVLTVWKKSLLFNCKGYTVFDGKGDLVFRVDNYMNASGSQGQILLMDAPGNPLLTVRRKRLSLGDNWLVYDGESSERPRFSARKHYSPTKSQLAHVGCVGGGGPAYEIEGSYSQRCCTIYECCEEGKTRRRKVAEIRRKDAVGGVAFGCDVFRLLVLPRLIDPSLAMAIVILLDQMYGSSRRLSS